MKNDERPKSGSIDGAVAVEWYRYPLLFAIRPPNGWHRTNASWTNAFTASFGIIRVKF